MLQLKNQKGFTIVELLIVVVVIAILAAITIVSYNGITRQANEASAKSSVATAQKKLATWFIENNDTFPPSLSQVGLADSGAVSYQYTVDNSTTPKGYCVTVTANGTQYRLGKDFTYTSGTSETINEAGPTSGACPGHTGGQTVTITNLQPNPGIEVNTTSFNVPNGSSIARDTSRQHSGAASLRVTMPTGWIGGNVGLTTISSQAVGVGILQPNAAYTVSMYVYVPTGTVDVGISLQGAGYATRSNPAATNTAVKNQWVRIHNTFTTKASGNVAIYTLNRDSTSGSTSFWVDDVMITRNESASPPLYADGNSAGWGWNGTPGLSSSSGPAL